LRKSEHSRWIELLLALPLTNPEIVLATALLSLFVGIDLPRGPLTLLLSHSLFCLSYAALILKARLAGFDPTLELAAQDLGHHRWRPSAGSPCSASPCHSTTMS
jgi:spermidine/putrescine transport system permease protein